MEDIVAVAAEIRAGMVGGIGRFVIRRRGVRERRALGFAGVKHIRRVTLRSLTSVRF